MKKIIIILLIIAGLVYFGPDILEKFREKEQTLTINEVVLKLEIANTRQEKEDGLSDRRDLAEDRAMLFVYNKEGRYGIWMKNMRISIDVIWFDSNLRVVDLVEGLTPETFPDIFAPREPAKYILETNAGFIKDVNIHFGDIAVIK